LKQESSRFDKPFRQAQGPEPAEGENRKGRQEYVTGKFPRLFP
jgi:hypothetical protein